MEARRLVRRSLETRKKELLAAWTRVAVIKERHGMQAERRRASPRELKME